jgi:hypothetical protein
MNLLLSYSLTDLMILILLLDSWMLSLSTRYTKFCLRSSLIHLLSEAAIEPAVYGLTYPFPLTLAATPSISMRYLLLLALL